MNKQSTNLGKLKSVHGLSPAYLQRALVVIILSFVFFLAMLIAFSIRQQIGYFVLATAFLIVNLFMLFGWMMQRKKEVRLYENGFTIDNQSWQYAEIKSISLKQMSQTKHSSEIIKTDGEKIVLPEAIQNVQQILEKIERKISSHEQTQTNKKKEN